MLSQTNTKRLYFVAQMRQKSTTRNWLLIYACPINHEGKICVFSSHIPASLSSILSQTFFTFQTKVKVLSRQSQFKTKRSISCKEKRRKKKYINKHWEAHASNFLNTTFKFPHLGKGRRSKFTRLLQRCRDSTVVVLKSQFYWLCR